MKLKKLKGHKNEVLGHRIYFKNGYKIIDQTILYSRAIETYERILDDNTFSTIALDTDDGITFFEERVAERRSGLRKIRPSTPLEKTRPQDIQSPSTLAGDHMLLPKMTQQDLDFFLIDEK